MKSNAPSTDEPNSFISNFLVKHVFVQWCIYEFLIQFLIIKTFQSATFYGFSSVCMILITLKLRSYSVHYSPFKCCRMQAIRNRLPPAVHAMCTIPFWGYVFFDSELQLYSITERQSTTKIRLLVINTPFREACTYWTASKLFMLIVGATLSTHLPNLPIQPRIDICCKVF